MPENTDCHDAPIPPSVLSSPPSGSQEAIGESRAFLDFQDQLGRVAPVERPVLLIGERGTGKEMAARRLHFLSKRWGQPFITLNCAALSPSLIESELFGHEEGAFTGARRKRRGRFEAADRGTLFLDEISLIPIETQEKILRVVEYGGFERVGGTETTHVDVRIIGATNANLSEEADAGRFKRDLLDRLSFEVLFLPPLREREEDIPVLARHFAARMAFELGRREIPEFSERAMKALLRHAWHGNIRELKNVVERAVYRSDGDQIEEFEFFPFHSPFKWVEEKGATAVNPGRSAAPVEEAQNPPPGPEAPPVPESAPLDDPLGLLLEEALDSREGGGLPGLLLRLEAGAMALSLRRAKYNQKSAAKKLGLTYHQFRGLYRKHADVLNHDKKD
jgi:psp operon transcriptional activator